MKITLNVFGKKSFWVILVSVLTAFLIISICSKSSFH